MANRHSSKQVDHHQRDSDNKETTNKFDDVLIDTGLQWLQRVFGTDAFHHFKGKAHGRFFHFHLAQLLIKAQQLLKLTAVSRILLYQHIDSLAFVVRTGAINIVPKSFFYRVHINSLTSPFKFFSSFSFSRWRALNNFSFTVLDSIPNVCPFSSSDNTPKKNKKKNTATSGSN